MSTDEPIQADSKEWEKKTAPIRVLVLVHGFPPLNHSGVFRTAAFVKHFRSFGIEPYVVTASDQNYGITSYAKSPEVPAALKSIPVERIPWNYQAPPTNSRLLRWIATRVPILWGLYRNARRRKFLRSLVPAVQPIVKKQGIQLIFATSSPPEALFLAEALARSENIPFISDLRDPWAYGWEAQYPSVVDFWMERQTEKRILRSAAAVIANTPASRRQLLEVYGLSPSRVFAITNGYDEDEFHYQLSDNSKFAPGNFNLIHAGTWGQGHAPTKGGSIGQRLSEAFRYMPIASNPDARSPRTLLKGLKIASDRDPAFRKSMRLHIVGALSDEAADEFKRSSVADNIVFHGSKRSASEPNAMCAAADLAVLMHISMYFKGRPYCTSVPGKLYNYLRTGTRIFAPMQESDATDIIRKYSAGTVVDPENPEAVADALLAEFATWRKGLARKNAISGPDLEQFERKQLTERLAKIIRDCVA